MNKLDGEASVKRAVKDLLDAEHILWWPMQSGKIKTQFGSWIQMCRKGTADILAAPNLPQGIANIPTPVYLWLELKAPSAGRITEEQFQFADEVRKRGHHHIFVSDVRQLVDWLKENRAR